jgi:DNA-binding IclR family transcriptional regulator
MKPFSDNNTGTIGKCMQIVEYIASQDSTVRFKDIQQYTAQPKGTLHRQLSNLVSEGLIELDPNGEYHTGIRLLALAHKSWNKNTLRTIARPFLEALHQETQETIHLGVLMQNAVIYLDKVESQQSIRMHSQIGNTSPVYCTGVGKAALSTLTASQLEKICNTIEYVQYTETTITSTADLQQEIQRIQQQGYALDNEEHEAGIFCASAPISNTTRGIHAGVSITAPLFRISTASQQQWPELVKNTAAEINKEIANRLSPIPFT